MLKVFSKCYKRLLGANHSRTSLPEESCSEVEVEEWLKRRRSGEMEKSVLILDPYVIRGWEASYLLVVNLSAFGLENLVIRAVGYCAVVKWK